MLVGWDPPTTPNGVITHYTLYINYTDGSGLFAIQTESSATSFVLTGLQTYQVVIVHLSATTTAGEGPASEQTEGRSAEAGVLHCVLVIFVTV